MNLTARALFVLALVLFGAPSRADDALEEVLVAGDQPGPGLWRISQGEHVLWVLGTLRPLPKDMKWRSDQVEARVAESQELILPSEIHVETNIGLLRGITLLPAMLKAAKNPDGAELEEVLPPETYAKWRALKAKYLGNGDGIESYRPLIAAARLRETAIGKSGLDRSIDVRKAVTAAAKKHDVRIRTLPMIERKVQIDNARAALKNARDLQIPDTDCVNRLLDRLEPDIQMLKVRANAWATGDIEVLRNSSERSDAEEGCFELLMNAVQSDQFASASDARKAIDDARRQSEQARQQATWNWLSAAQGALARNRSTFAVVRISELMGGEGYAAKLESLGYEVREP